MTEKILLNDEELEKTAGGMSDSEAQNVPIGARLRIISGYFEDQCVTVVGYARDMFTKSVMGFRVQFDDGRTETVFNNEVYLI